MTDTTDPAVAAALHERFGEVIDQLRAMEDHVLTHDNALHDPQSVTESYKWIFSMLAVGLDCFVWGDPARPRFVDIVGPHRKWGGDNVDAFYQYIPVDPTRTYRVHGTKGDAVYFSLTVYGGPDDGRYSERIVGSANDRDVTFDADGRFEIVVGPARPDGWDGAFIELAPDAVCAITRDYLEEPTRGRRLLWSVDVDDAPTTWREDPARLTTDLGRVITWLRDQMAIAPLGLGELNHVDDPYPVPTETFGWAAGDASYAMGSFALGPDEALVLRGRSPGCTFWNLCLWNPMLHTYNSAYEPVSINGAQVTYLDDGSWELVVAHRDPGRPNWVHTQGHDRGRLWFRWFLPDHTPAPIEAEVVTL